MQDNFKANHSKVIAVNVKENANSGVFTEGGQIIEGCLVHAIETHVYDNCPLTPSNRAVASDSMLKASYLHLGVNNSEEIQQIHMPNLLRSNNNGKPYEIVPTVINWSNTKIVFPDPTENSSTSDFLFTIYYSKK